MPTLISFVADMVTNSPATVLDLNAPPINLAPGADLSPSDFDIGWTDNPMTDGALQNRSKATNRVLRIPLQVVSTTAAGFSQAIEDLGEQLARDNILRVQFSNSASPIFFRTFANPKYATQIKGVLSCAVQYQLITLEIIASPNGYGPRVTAGTFTVANDPEAATNPCRFDVSSVQGDQPTPLLLHATSTAVTGTPSGLVNKWVHIGMRRRGTPSNYVNHIQAEDMTQGTGAVATVDATMSGGDKSRIGFGTPGNTLRLSDTFPGNGTATVEARGLYRVYGRMSKTVAGDNINVTLGYGASSAAAIFNETKTLPAGIAGPYLVDLGKVPVPAWSDPVRHGYSGVLTKVVLPFVGLWAARVGGSGSLDVDYLYFVPADDLTIIARFPSTDTLYAIDGTTDEGGACYAMPATLDEITTTAGPVQIVGGGGFPEVAPGQTNRLHIMRQVDPSGANLDNLTSTTTWVAYYWPQWRELTRP